MDHPSNSHAKHHSGSNSSSHSHADRDRDSNRDSASSSAALRHHHLRSARNDDGLQCLPAFDPLHSMSVRMYCGRPLAEHGGYSHPCPGRGPSSHSSGLQCDGKCGPDGGCQCKSCYRLNAEMRKREAFLQSLPRDAMQEQRQVQVQVSFNKSSHAPKKGYQFYCGRTVGRAQYYNHCQLCEGKCGPRTGCQCVDCHELEILYERMKKDSRDSSPNKSSKHSSPATSPLKSALKSEQSCRSPTTREVRIQENSHVPSIIPFSPIFCHNHYQSTSSDYEGDIVSQISLMDLNVEDSHQSKLDISKIESVEQCENIEMKLEDLLHVVRQRKRALIAHGRQQTVSHVPKSCIVCNRAPRNHVIVPCGHLCVCESCASLIRTNERQTCPACNELVNSVQRVVS